jgi:hypothetical protein
VVVNSSSSIQVSSSIRGTNDSRQFSNLGISHAYGGVLSGLSITYSLNPLDPPSNSSSQKKKNRRWIEKEVVSAVYQTSSKILVEDTRELVGLDID